MESSFTESCFAQRHKMESMPLNGISPAWAIHDETDITAQWEERASISFGSVFQRMTAM
jgi:hypothetical protein